MTRRRIARIFFVTALAGKMGQEGNSRWNTSSPPPPRETAGGEKDRARVSARARKRVCVSACEREADTRDRETERESEREWHGILFKEPNPNREPPKRPTWAL